MPAGRPTKMTPETIGKLEEAFSMGCTDLEACLFADIEKTTLYKYQQDHPEFINRKEKLKENPVLKARQTILDNLEDPTNARWYLERKKKDEFSQRTESDVKTVISFDQMGDDELDGLIESLSQETDE
jgi:hypothetical protein